MTDPIRTDLPLTPHDPRDLTHFWCLTRACAMCGDRKHPNDFYTKAPGEGHPSPYCKPCREEKREADRNRPDGRMSLRKFTDTDKWCPDCEAWLPHDAFSRNRHRSSGLSAYCRYHERERRAERQRIRKSRRADHIRHLYITTPITRAALAARYQTSVDIINRVIAGENPWDTPKEQAA